MDSNIDYHKGHGPQQPNRKRRQPSLQAMESWVANGVAKATDGCRVEPNGECPHGHQSWLIVLGFI